MQRAAPSKLTSLNIIISSFAALAGVALAAYQVLAPSTPSTQAPVNVTVTLDPAKAAVTETVAAKADAEAPPQMSATYTAAFKDGSGERYDFAALFDGKPETTVTLAAPDAEINVLVTFAAPQMIGEIDYAPPKEADPGTLATVADIMVLPDGQLEVSGRPVSSFKLPVEGGVQSYALGAPEEGKGLWLRVAGGTVIGDFRIRPARP